MALRPTLLIVGCGDVGLRVLRQLPPWWRVLALTSSAGRLQALREAGAVPILGDLDRPHTLWRLGSAADAVLHLAPPQPSGPRDLRTRALLRVLERGGRTRRLIYASTSGVYGDCAGALVHETRPLRPQSERAQRRVDAEATLRAFGRRGAGRGVRVSILRIPGIYAPDRPGGHPRERLQRGTPVLVPADDVFTNHIHADDLARACVAALHRGAPQRAYHASDDTDLRMGDYMDLAADLAGLPRPRRITRAEAEAQMPAMAMSFLRESRRLDNTRLARELGVRLRYPTVADGL